MMTNNPAKEAPSAVYLIKTEDPSSKNGRAYYRSHDFTRYNTSISLRGSLLDENVLEKLKSDISFTPDEKALESLMLNTNEFFGVEVDIEIPLSRVISIKNVTYTGTNKVKRKAAIRNEGQLQ